MDLNPRERPPSLSPSPEMERSSSSPLSPSCGEPQRQAAAKLRRHEIVDGLQVWISESPRRRCTVPKSRRPEDVHRRPRPSMDTGMDILRDGSYDQLERRPTLDSSSLQPSNDHLQPAPPSPKRSVADQIRRHDSMMSTSEMSSKLLKEQADFTSPPPTPRITRLKTPELPSLKVKLFCDCQPCQQASGGIKRVIIHSDGGISGSSWP